MRWLVSSCPRGIGLIAKLKAYELQDLGHDTVEANRELGLPVDGRDYREAAQVLVRAGVRGVRLLTNNPDKASALEAGGIAVEEVVPLQTAPHARNLGYLETKRQRLGHLAPGGAPLTSAEVAVHDSWTESSNGQGHVLDVSPLLGEVRRSAERPYVLLKYAQTLDGRIATASGDARWISGVPERRVSHAMRAACDAVMVGIGTVLRDDPRLTVRMVPGASPIRVILDSKLRVPPHAGVLDSDAVTIVLTTARSSPARREALRERRVRVEVVQEGPDGVDLREGLGRLAELGIRSLLVEGGARVITSLLRERAVDRVVVALAPLLLGKGTEAVGDLGGAAIEAASLVEDRDEIAEVGGAGRRVEMAVLADEPLELVQQRQAPARVRGAADPLAGDVDVHRRGVGQHRGVERVGVTAAAGDGGDPGRSALQGRLQPQLGVRVARRHDPVGPDQRQALGPGTLGAGPDVEPVAGRQVEQGARSLPVHLQCQPRPV